MNARRPERLEALLAAFLPHDRRDDVLADLDEEFQALAAAKGARFARRWYAAQIGRSVPPVVGRWLHIGIAASVANAGAPPVGALFFAASLLWFAGVASTLPIGEPREEPAIAAAQGWRPAAVQLEDGSAHFVYSLSDRPEARHPPRYSGTDALIRFSVVALAPPAATAFGLLLGLSILDAARRRRHRVGGTGARN